MIRGLHVRVWGNMRVSANLAGIFGEAARVPQTRHSGVQDIDIWHMSPPNSVWEVCGVRDVVGSEYGLSEHPPTAC